MVSGYAPYWALLTPYRVQVIRTKPANKKVSQVGFERALKTMAEGYVRFNPEKARERLPWGGNATHYRNTGNTHISMRDRLMTFLERVTN